MHVVESLDFGGIETRMKILAEHTQTSPFSHHFVAISRGGRASLFIRRCGSNVRICHVSSRIPSLAATLAIVREIRNCRAEIVHCHGAEANFHGIIAATVAGVRIRIAEEVGIASHSMVLRGAFKTIYLLASRLTVVSAATKKNIVRLREAEDAKIVVLDSPARLNRDKIRPLQNKGQPTILFVGRLESVKNPLAAILALAELAKNGFTAKLKIMGDGSMRPEVEEAIEALDLGSQVEVLGFVDRPFEGLTGDEIFLQPSHSEGFSMALVEAMSAGALPIVSDVGGNSEIVKDGQSGWLLTSLDPESIASKIVQVWSLPVTNLERIRRAGQDAVLGRFGPEQYVAHLEELYSNLLKANAG